jgi:hypothetical protein
MLYFKDFVVYFKLNLKKKYQFVYFGFETCPYSKHASKLIREWELQHSVDNTSLFQRVERASSNRFKSDLNYHGTFPIVFVSDSNGKMSHIGGAEDLGDIIKGISPLVFNVELKKTSKYHTFNQREITNIYNKSYKFILNNGFKKDCHKFAFGSQSKIRQKFHMLPFTTRANNAHFVLMPDGASTPSKRLQHLKVVNFSSLWTLPTDLLPFMKKSIESYEGKIITTDKNTAVVRPPMLLSAPPGNGRIDTRKILNSIKSVTTEISNPPQNNTNNTNNNSNNFNNNNTNNNNSNNFNNNNTNVNNVNNFNNNDNDFISKFSKPHLNLKQNQSKQFHNALKQNESKLNSIAKTLSKEIKIDGDIRSQYLKRENLKQESLENKNHPPVEFKPTLTLNGTKKQSLGENTTNEDKQVSNDNKQEIVFENGIEQMKKSSSEFQFEEWFDGITINTHIQTIFNLLWGDDTDSKKCASLDIDVLVRFQQIYKKWTNNYSELKQPNKICDEIQKLINNMEEQGSSITIKHVMQKYKINSLNVEDILKNLDNKSKNDDLLLLLIFFAILPMRKDMITSISKEVSNGFKPRETQSAFKLLW